MTLEAIKEAIEHLPAEERRRLLGWFEQELRQEISHGKARPLEEGLAKRRRSRL